jgi:alkylated DNA repair dioxygenase AlkB
METPSVYSKFTKPILIRLIKDRNISGYSERGALSKLSKKTLIDMLEKDDDIYLDTPLIRKKSKQEIIPKTSPKKSSPSLNKSSSPETYLDMPLIRKKSKQEELTSKEEIISKTSPKKSSRSRSPSRYSSPSRSPSPKKSSPSPETYFFYKEDFLDNPQKYFERLIEEIPFEQRSVKVFGKDYNEPRLTSIHGDDRVLDKVYVYSKSVRKLLPMTKTLKKIQDQIEKYTGIHFVLLNLYRDGNDKVGWHSDDEKMMDCSNIVSISLGAPRKFRFKKKSTKQIVWEKHLASGSLVWMRDLCQEKLLHEVPREKSITEPRINLTFRKFK